MLSIRLSRVGKKKYAAYKIIVQEKARDPWGKVLEFLGTYNPHTKELVIKKERVEYWLSCGAQMSATINNLFIKKEIIKGKKRKATRINTKERMAERKKKEDENKAATAKVAEKSKEEIKEEIKDEDKTEVKEEIKEKISEEINGSEPQSEEVKAE